MYNPLNKKYNKTIFIDGNDVACTKSSKEIMSLLFSDVPVVLRLHMGDDFIFAHPTFYDYSENVVWFVCVDDSKETHIVGVDSNKELVYNTGE